MRNQLSPKLVNLFRAIVMGYNHDRYWKYLMIVNNKSSKCPKLLKMLMFIYLKRTDAKWNCSFGANFNGGSKWITPHLPHGPNGIIVGQDCTIGRNVVIYQQVTISQYVDIGNNVLIGAGAKILRGVKVGNNVKIGANCVVVEDLPDNCTCVLYKPRLIIKNNI